MPLVRFEVRNEYGLGDPGLFRGAVARREDPKTVLDGVAAAGLVGILRQLGDLAELAADVFNGLHEQVSETSARSRKLMSRIKRVEETLPSLEEVVRNNASCLHLAYVEGSDWHAKIRPDQNRLLRSDLPKFMMDSYEECHDPPRLYLLDKFDSGGVGACFKRYSDPTYFKRIWDGSKSVKAEKARNKMMSQKNKRKVSLPRNGIQIGTWIPQNKNRSQLASPASIGRSFSTEGTSTSDTRRQPENVIGSVSGELRRNFSSVKDVKSENPALVPEILVIDKPRPPNPLDNHDVSSAACLSAKPQYEGPRDVSFHNSDQEETGNRSPTNTITWDEKTEIVKPGSPRSCDDILVDEIEGPVALPTCSEIPPNSEDCTAVIGAVDKDSLHIVDVPESSVYVGSHFDEANNEADNYMDALNTMESETESDSQCQTKREVKSSSGDRFEENDASSADRSDITSSADSNDREPAQEYADETVSGGVIGDEISESLNFRAPEKSGFEDDNGDRPNAEQAVADTSRGSSKMSALTPEFSEIHDRELSVTKDSEIGSSWSSELSMPSLQDKVCDRDAVKLPTRSCSFPPNAASATASVRIWTNGNLLGLEPSKPPDFGNSGAANDIEGGVIKFGEPSGVNITSNGNKSKSKILCEHENVPRNDSQESLQSPSLNENVTHEDMHFNEIDDHEGRIPDTLKLQERRPLDSNFEEESIRHVPREPYRQKSDEKLLPETPRKSFSSCSSHIGRSSPPLEHMKISVATGLETSILKLSLSNISSCGSGEDVMFPSFQLLPGSVAPPPDGGLESDDETLCGSSPDTSEDIILSPRSDSNSDMWEQEETGIVRDHQMYCESPPLYEVGELVEMNSYSLDSHEIGSLGHDNGLSLQPGLIMELPVIDSIESQSDQVMGGAPNSPDKLPPSSPPACPPAQRKTTSAACTSEEENISFVTDVDQPVPHRQLEESVSNGPSIGEIKAFSCKTSEDEHKQDPWKAANLAVSQDQKLDQREDFLQQIKNRAFNLRPAVASKPNLAPRQPPTNAHVAAILEKASAIRQACMGSDDGEDDDGDSWSDS